MLLITHPAISLGGTILVLGDSLSAGYGLQNPSLGWVGLLQEKLKTVGKSHTLINASISGDTSAGGLARVDALLTEHKPVVLILELGANDGLRGLVPANMQANLGEIMNRAQRSGVQLLLLGIRIPPNYGPRYNQLFEAVFPALAKQFGAAYVPFLLDGVGGHSELMQADGLHPNQQAQLILMNNVWAKLLPLL